MIPSMIALAALAPAFAQDPAVPELNAQNLHLSVDSTRTLATDDTSLGETGSPTARLMFHYTDDPLVYETTEGDTFKLLSNLLQADLLAGISVSRFRFGLDLPVLLLSNGDLGNGGAGIGDLALDAKAIGLSREDFPVGLGLAGRLSLPTSTVGAPVGAAGLAYEISLVADADLGPVLLAANVGTRGTPAQELENIVVNDQFTIRGGAGYAITENAGVAAELMGLLAYSAPLANPAGAPLEWLASGWGRVAQDVVVRGGVGAGITPGIGSPDLRALISVGYEPGDDRDTDGDGLVDRDDPCPLDAEDLDDWEDTDGCPEPDNDLDGLLDAVDQCRNDPEDLDTWRDDDGCPDPEVQATIRVLDQDGNPVDLVKVIVAGDSAKFAGGGDITRELEPGGFELTANANGFAPLEAAFSLEPGAPQVFEFKLTPVETSITVSRDRIDLKESIYFETGKAVIKAESFGLLDEVVKILGNHPEIVRLRIEGHTDSRGSASANQKLSEARAASVLQYFVDHGVAAERLLSVGFGESKPLDPAENAAAWEKNRRLDFLVEEWKEQ